MGISSSRARDYAQRGIIFLKYKNDFVEGIENIPGISLNDFVVSHMSKLTLYDKAVAKFGRKEALSHFSTNTFRDFQKMLIEKSVRNTAEIIRNPQKDTSSDSSSTAYDSSSLLHEAQKSAILELDLSFEEKRLLRIIAKKGKYRLTKGLTKEQVLDVEIRLQHRRVAIIENNLKMAHIGFERKSYNPDNPLAISDELYKLNNINDIILRIREGLTLIVPARRIIAILTYRLKCNNWTHPRFGVHYSNFRDFAFNELGMGEEYRDYLKVGEVLYKYYYFLDHLSDIDTEDMFFKLRYLPEAMITHKENEPLILARLRSLSIRDFKLFSEYPDFEITFSKHLNKKQLEVFEKLLMSIREPYSTSGALPTSVFEVYDASEYSIVDNIVDEVLAEAGDLMKIPERVKYFE
jgi:hypothetical protein